MKVMPLLDAIDRFVKPGMHLHFASTPSRSNAAIRALCRRFRGTTPAFTFSSTGFHSSAHLLGRFRLGARYLAAFYGDNYPVPRPNPLYARLLREGIDLEHVSVHSYVVAFRAGALGHRWGVINSIKGSSLEKDLQRRGEFISMPDPTDPSQSISLVAAQRPDLAFVHVPGADPQGNAIASLPACEGIWGALGARTGVIVTTESVVGGDVIRRAAESILLPAHRVLAVCPAPFGAHPQPLFAPRHLELPSYADDFDAYELFRAIGADETSQARLVDDVLLGDDSGYAAHFDLCRRAPAMKSPKPLSVKTDDPHANPPINSEKVTVLAARKIAALVRSKAYRVILAGVGNSFFAVRMAALELKREGMDVDVLVETGMLGIDCGPDSGPFLLGFDVISRTRRLSSIEDVLGAITCGSNNRCLGVIGAAQVDGCGNLNSTLLSDGTLLVGSGGANDIASSAEEVVVLTSCDSQRLVAEVPYVTSPGRAVTYVITEEGALHRTGKDGPWHLESVLDPGNSSLDAKPLGDRLRQICPWPLTLDTPQVLPPISTHERRLLNLLNPQSRARRASQLNQG